MSEYDSPWKEALDAYFAEFLQFLFPNVHDDIDWSRGYEALDKEFQQIVLDAELGKRLTDKLVKVWRKNGEETWVLIHVEVQAQPDADFAERMFIYHYRIYDRFRHIIASLAVLGDERPNWRPQEFRREIWGSEIKLRFATVKLLDYADDFPALEANPNVFALIVAAHLQSHATRNSGEQRRDVKIRLVKSLFDRGLIAEDVRRLFLFIDWLMDLPLELTKQFAQEIHDYQEEKKMPYISSIERLAIEKGREEGREEGRREEITEMIITRLQHSFPDASAELLPKIQTITDLEELRMVYNALLADDIETVHRLLAQ